MNVVKVFHVGDGVFELVGGLPGGGVVIQPLDQIPGTAIEEAGVGYFLQLPLFVSLDLDGRRGRHDPSGHGVFRRWFE